MSKQLQLPLTAIVAMFLLSACGGGGGAGSSSSSPSSDAITIFAGEPFGSGNANGSRNNASFYNPWGVAVDSSGNTYVADYRNHTIRRITPEGVVSTYAGKAGSYGHTNGSLTDARFYYPAGLVFDSAGNLFVSEPNNAAIRKITPAGVVSTFAGSSYGHQDGTGTGAKFGQIVSIAVDSTDNLYVADDSFHVIRKISPAAVVTTLAGSPSSSGTADGNGSSAQFKTPRGIAVDNAGNVFVADTANNAIRKIAPNGDVSTFAGLKGSTGSTNGTGTAARFSAPHGLLFDANGNLLVADQENDLIRKISPNAVVSTIAGGSMWGTDGVGTAAGFRGPRGLAKDTGGNIYIVDSGSHIIRKLATDGTVSTLAGRTVTANRKVEGSREAARFMDPEGITVDSDGTILVSESTNIRKIASNGNTSLFVGNYSSAGATDGSGTSARFDSAAGMTISQGNLFVLERSHDTVRKVTAAGLVSTLAGTNGASGTTDGTGAAARFNGPRNAVADASGNLYLTDHLNGTVRRIDGATGAVTTFAGTPGVRNTTDGKPGNFYAPYGIAMDRAGNLYVADFGAIRKITPDGTVSTLAGDGYTAHEITADGTGTSAHFMRAEGLVIDSDDNLYVADSQSYTIRKVTPSGVVTTVVGTMGVKGLHTGSLPGVIGEVSDLAIQGKTLYLLQSNGIVRVALP